MLREGQIKGIIREYKHSAKLSCMSFSRPNDSRGTGVASMGKDLALEVLKLRRDGRFLLSDADRILKRLQSEGLDIERTWNVEEWAFQGDPEMQFRDVSYKSDGGFKDYYTIPFQEYLGIGRPEVIDVKETETISRAGL